MLDFNKRLDKAPATAILKRDKYKASFGYVTLEPRKFLFDDPIMGFKSVIAKTTIKTNANFNFVLGDKIYLEEATEPLQVVNLTRKADEKQYLLIKASNRVEYILDMA
jgi:hypothetical protein